MSFIEFVRYLFGLEEVKGKKLSFLSNVLCQDLLEKFFGCQRQRGATNDNPTVMEFVENTQSLSVINSFCRGAVRRNCRQQDTLKDTDCMPLPKRKRQLHNND